MTYRYSDTFDDQKSHPYAGALVAVTTIAGATAVLRDADGGPLNNPLTTAADGGFEYYADAGIYQHDFYVGGRKVYTDRYVQVGPGPVLPAEIIAALSANDGAALIGSIGPNTVQADITARPTSATLSASTGASLMGRTTLFTGVPATVAQAVEHIVPLSQFYQAGYSDVQTLNAAIVAMNARTPENVPGGISQGTVLILPQSRLTIGTGLTKLTKNGGVTIRGAGIGATELVVSHTGVVFDFDPSALTPFNYDVTGAIEHMTVTYPTTPNANACVMRMVTAVHGSMSNVAFKNVQTLVRLGDESDATKTVSSFTARHVHGTKANTAGALFDLRQGSHFVICKDSTARIEGITPPAATTLSTMASAIGSKAFSFGVGSWDTASISGLWYGFDYGCDIDVASGKAVGIVSFPDAVFDYCKSRAIRLRANAGSNISLIDLANAYCVGWDGYGIEGIGPGGLSIVKGSPVVNGAAGDGIRFSGASTTEINLTDAEVIGAGRNVAGSSAILFDNGVTNFGVRGCRAPFGSFSFTWQSPYGLYLGNDLTDYTIADNAMKGATQGYVLGTNAAGSATRTVRGNRNANYAGFQSTGVYVLPASTVAWTNTSGCEVEVSIAGGTVTVVAKNGVTTGLTSGTLTIGPGDTFAVTYSVAPTAKFYVKP